MLPQGITCAAAFSFGIADDIDSDVVHNVLIVVVNIDIDNVGRKGCWRWSSIDLDGCWRQRCHNTHVLPLL